jgi:hypothetical protein
LILTVLPVLSDTLRAVRGGGVQRQVVGHEEMVPPARRPTRLTA